MLLFLASANFFNISVSKPILNISKEDTALNFKSNFLKNFNFGLKRFISSYIWVQTIIESDVEQYKKADGNSWIYHRIISITTLDPDFEWAYLWGGQYLSVIKDDIQGAKDVYEKGIRLFPYNFWLNFNAGFHYYWELGDCQSAYEVFNRILNLPAALQNVFYLPSLVARAKACTGDLETAFLIINDTFKNAQENSELQTKLHQNAYALKAEIDLKCLNQKQPNCATTDFNNMPYVYRNGVYQAEQKWEPYRLKTRLQRNL